MWQGFRQASMASWPATTDVRGPVLQWTMRLTMNQTIAGTVNTLTVWVTNCMGTVSILSVLYSIHYIPLSLAPIPSPAPPSPPSSPTHRYKVKIYRNLKATKYSSQVHKNHQTLSSTKYWARAVSSFKAIEKLFMYLRAIFCTFQISVR